MTSRAAIYCCCYLEEEDPNIQICIDGSRPAAGEGAADEMQRIELEPQSMKTRAEISLKSCGRSCELLCCGWPDLSSTVVQGRWKIVAVLLQAAPHMHEQYTMFMLQCQLDRNPDAEAAEAGAIDSMVWDGA